MKIKTLKPHSNIWGAKYKKSKGDVYECTSPEPLINAGLAEEYKPKPEKKNDTKPEA